MRLPHQFIVGVSHQLGKGWTDSRDHAVQRHFDHSSVGMQTVQLMLQLGAFGCTLRV
jgi:hypothetical protein